MVNDPQVRNIPGLNEFVITAFSGTDVGNKFVVFLRAFTREAGVYLDSERTSLLLADVPDKPPSTPVLVQAFSSATRLQLTYPALSSSANGGSPVLSYSLEWDGDSSKPGEWVSLIGYPRDNLATTYNIEFGVRKGSALQVQVPSKEPNGLGSLLRH